MKGVDLWWSEKIKNHSGNVQAVSAPNGYAEGTLAVAKGKRLDSRPRR